MNGIRVILFLIISIISIVNMISFYSKKSKDKKESKEKLNTLTPHRTLTVEEAEILSRHHKKNIEANSPVYYLEGEYEEHTLKTNNQTSDIIQKIGGVVIHPHKSIQSLLTTATKVEVTDIENKKGAIVVSINDSVSVITESNISKAIEDGHSYSEKNAEGEHFTVKQGRELTIEEALYLKKDLRVLFNLLTISLLITPIFINNIYVSIGCVIGASIITYLILLPQFPRGFETKIKGKLTLIEGTILDKNGDYIMNKFIIFLPKECDQKLTIGSTQELGGIVEGPAQTHFKVLTINNRSIIPTTPKKGRFIFSLVISLLTLLLLLTPALGNILYKMSSVSEYYLTKDLQKNFTDFNDLNNYDLKVGQEVSIDKISTTTNISYSGNYVSIDKIGTTTNISYSGDYVSFYGPNGIYILEKGALKEPDFTNVVEYLEKLYQLQSTEGYLGVLTNSIDDLDTYYYFLDNFLDQDVTLESHSEYKDFLSSGEYSLILYDLMDFILTIDGTQTGDDKIFYPQAGNLKKYMEKIEGNDDTIDSLASQIIPIYNSFFDEQLKIVQDKTIELLEPYIKNRDVMIIQDYKEKMSYSYNYEDSEYISSVGFDLSQSDIKKYVKGSYGSTRPLYRVDQLYASEAINEIITKLNNDIKITEPLTGIIREIFQSKAGKTISIDYGSNYEILDQYLIDIAHYIIILLFAVFSILGIKPIKKENY